MPQPIGQALRQLAGWGAAATLAAASGCSADTDSEGLGQSVPTGRWLATSCEPNNGGVNVFIGGVNLARNVDHASLYRSFPSGTGQGGRYAAGARNFGGRGVPCEGVDDAEACNAALKDLNRPNPSCDTGGECLPFLLTATGEDVQRIDAASELIELLGTIDTPAEAVIVAVWNGLTAECPQRYSPELRGTEVAERDGGGYLVRSEWSGCGGPATRETISVTAQGEPGDLVSEKLGVRSNCVIGRRPVGLQAAAPASTTLGGFFAETCRLEAASVCAFERLARELLQLGAPQELITLAARSALDEVRHTQLTAALARRFGSEPIAPSVARTPVRSRCEIALENAVEGCARETFGAIVAHHQAATARDAHVAANMREIAADETRHATLSWQIAAWLDPQLTAAERGAVREAQRTALQVLLREVAEPVLTPREERLIGWPSVDVSLALVARMAHVLGL